MADSMTDNANAVIDFNVKVSESSEAGETFYKLFYEHLDKKRTVSCVFGLIRILPEIDVIAVDYTFLY